MAGERVRSFLNREPPRRRIGRRVKRRSSKLRNRPSQSIIKNLPKLENRNIGGGTLVGAALAGVAVVLQDTIGIPFGASSDILNTESVSGGTLYTVNVNAPTEVMADARATIDSTTGFTSFITDGVTVRSVEVLNERLARDTYQVKVLVEN